MATDPTSPAAAAPRYSLPPVRLPLEDILFCVDVDPETRAEMKTAAASSGPATPARPAVTRMDAVKQAMLLFVHGKLAMCPDHRFAFASLGDTVSMVLFVARPDLVSPFLG
jgi:BRISC and BRCA1-A complex member 1